MERMFKKFLSATALVSAVAIQTAFASSSSSSPVVSPVLPAINARSVSFNGARKVSGEVGKTHKDDEESWYGNFSMTPGYEQSFRSKEIAGCLFGDFLASNTNTNNSNNCGRRCDDDCGRSLNVQGSEISGSARATNALLADYFYLPTDFASTLSFQPKISSFFIDFNFYLGLDEWWKGGYLRVYAPFVHTRRDLKMRETITTPGTSAYPTGYFAPAEIPASALLSNATQYFSGQAPVTFAATAPNTDTIKFNGLCFSKIRGAQDCDKSCDGDRTRNGFGEIRAELGWDFWQGEDYHFGLNLQAAAPTGNRPKAEWLFDAVVGNGKHWELGAGATGHYTFWRGQDDRKHFSINMDLSVLHLFGSRQQRTFDLAYNSTTQGGGALSRYMLAAKFRPAVDGDVNGLVGIVQTPADYVFNDEYTPVANLTTQDVKISVGAQVDFTAWFNFTSGGFSGDLGYNLWYSGCEKINCNDDKCPTNNCCNVQFAANTWALKGDELVFGFTATPANTPVPLSASNSSATILGFSAGNDNVDIDNAQLAAIGALSLNDAPGEGQGDSRVFTSIQPVFITQADLDNAIAKSAKSRQTTNKLFGHAQYTWDREGWVPYLGAGVSAEWGNGKSCEDDCRPSTTTNTSANCNSDCDDCVKCSVSQWAVWAKTGFQF